ncbi:Asp23/Gls24 family envelope stress response protein [Helicovermis profundi]|uniref:Asp23/Gls24 family envelope stress response protein n=1 Tax=Helicovermis profundi TaxID=3065157 RepID=A0AAU9E6H2_9FIRM|nr:Asp23/Gls24 family envelope stress response protein [Clostridia bacterium S502]
MAENTNIDSLEYGNVNISDDVIGIITSIAASEIKGVSGLYGGFTDNLGEKLGIKNLKKGIKIDIQDEKVNVLLNIVVDYGIKIPDISWKIQENVKNAIESMTGLLVNEVNIHVHGINISKKTVKDTLEEEL